MGQSGSGVTLNTHIPFQNNEERITGYALGPADLLGQMSADDYIKKLPILYNEFVEVYRFEGLDKKTDRAVRCRKAPMILSEVLRHFMKVWPLSVLNLWVHSMSTSDYILSSDNPYPSAIEKNIAFIKERWK